MSDKEFVIATFNLENLDDKDKLWPKHRDALKPMLGRLEADLLFLQEVNTVEALNEILKDSCYEGYEQAITKTEEGHPYKERNLVILSRYKIQSTNQYLNHFTRPPVWCQITEEAEGEITEKKPKEVLWERPILHCEISMPKGRVLHAIDLHLKSKIPSDIKGQKKGQYLWLSHEGWAEGSFLSSVKRVGQALETRKLLSSLFKQDPEAMIVVAGDFNAEIGSVPFQVIVGSVEETSNPDLRSTVMIPCEYDVPPDQRYSLIHHGKGEMIDHIIVSQALYPRWIETEIYNEILQDESIAFATKAKFPESDHAPIADNFRPLD